MTTTCENSNNEVCVERAVLDGMLVAVLEMIESRTCGRMSGEERILKTAYELGIAVYGEHGWREKMEAWTGRRGVAMVDRALQTECML